jgi:serine/threonine protein phosphatase PrpC
MGRVPSKPNKVNQDSYLIIQDFLGIKGSYLFGIMDGHGTFGHEASDLVKKRLPGIIL